MFYSLMSIFDPTVLSFPVKWIQGFLILFLIISSFFVKSSGYWEVFLQQISFLMKILSQGLKTPKGSIIFLTSLFVFILFVNETGMVPFVFTSSSHLVFDFSFSFCFWLSGVFLLSPQSFLAHLVPQGCPTFLSPFLVFIELISLGMRPLSLGMRLMSNIIAGHMILLLIQSMCGHYTVSSVVSMIISGFFLMFELMVGVIQAFVFTNLSFMYLKESESH